ncbi:unnamed protein product, partial [Clonostachys rhizophaga]
MPEMGKSNAANVAASLRSSFPEIKLVIMSGICGAVPEYRTSEGAVQEIVLGDVVISNGISTSYSDPVCDISRTSPCSQLGCDSYTSPIMRERHATTPQPLVHLGKYASGDMVMKSGEDRDKIAERESVIAFEMEGAGVWDNFPCIVIKGACDYADSHKNKDFQGYTAATSAACTNAFLEEWFLASQSTQGGAHSEYTRPSPAIREIDIVALEIFGLPVSEANRCHVLKPSTLHIGCRLWRNLKVDLMKILSRRDWKPNPISKIYTSVLWGDVFSRSALNT